MCKNTLVTLTPLKPRDNSYDPANPDAPYGTGFLFSNGGITSVHPRHSLSGQAAADEIVLGRDPVSLADKTIQALDKDIDRRSAITCVLKGHNISEDNQYLMIFSLEGEAAPFPTAQFFVGTDLIRAEEIDGKHQVALLMDVPGNSTFVVVYVRLASESMHSALIFKSLSVSLL